MLCQICFHPSSKLPRIFGMYVASMECCRLPWSLRLKLNVFTRDWRTWWRGTKVRKILFTWLPSILHALFIPYSEKG